MTDRTSGPVDAPISRRTLLAVAGSGAFVSLSGCLAEGNPATTETTLTLTDTATGETRTPVDTEEVTLGRLEYYYFAFSLDGPTEVSYQVDVVSGDPVHVYVVTPEEYEILAEEESGFEAIEGSVIEETYSGNETVSLDSGDYRLIIVNTNADVLPENV